MGTKILNGESMADIDNQFSLDHSHYAAAVREVYKDAVEGLTCCGVSHRPNDNFATVEFAQVIGTISRGPWKGTPRWDRKTVRSFTVASQQLAEAKHRP